MPITAEHVRLRTLASYLRSTYWFVPSLMGLAGIAGALLTLALDRAIIGSEPVAWLFDGDTAAARAVLETVAGSMITVAGVAFSITVVALSLASRQFGPLLLRGFMRDRPNQIFFGTFVATFLYCLFVLRTIYEGGAAIPHVSVTVAIGLGAASVGVFVYFIHHIAQSIRLEGVLSRVDADLDRLVETCLSEARGGAIEGGAIEARLPEDFARRTRVVAADDDGYVETRSDEELVRIACEHDLVLEAVVRPYDFVLRGEALLRAYPSERCTESVAHALSKAVVVGSDRSSADDLRSGMEQLVQLALRALSPSLNDPQTAMAAMDRMTGLLARVAALRPAEGAIPGPDGAVRLIAPRTSLDELLEEAFDPIRRNAGRQAEVWCCALRCVAKLAPRLVVHARWRRTAAALVGRMASTARSEVLAGDRERVARAAELAREALEGPVPRPPGHAWAEAPS